MPISNKEYINNSSLCPVCGSGNVTGHMGDCNNNVMYYNLLCMDCLSSWTDVYRLAEISGLIDKDENEIVVVYD